MQAVATQSPLSPTESHEADELTVVLLGAASVGKTCLRIRLVKNTFELDTIPTIEDMATTVKLVDGMPCKLSVLDTAGQEDFRAMLDYHLGRESIFLLVYSITDSKSFTEVQQFHEKIVTKRTGDDFPSYILLFGNKLDLQDTARAVSSADGEALAQQWGVPFMEGSARTGEMVIDAFSELVRKARRADMDNAYGKATDEDDSDKKCVCLIL